MAELIDGLRIWVESIIFALGYSGIAFVILVENLIPPIPSELVLPMAGFLVAEGRFTFWGVIAASTSGSVAGALVLYLVGRWLGEPMVRHLLRRYGRYIGVVEQDLDRALNIFQTRGDLIVFLGRLIPVVRSLISLPAGMRRMPIGRFLVFTALGSCIWNSALVYSGYVLGANWAIVLDVVKQYQRGVLVVLAMAGLIWIGLRLLRRGALPGRPRVPDVE